MEQEGYKYTKFHGEELALFSFTYYFYLYIEEIIKFDK